MSTFQIKAKNQKTKRNTTRTSSKKGEDVELLFTILPPATKKKKKRSRKEETESESEESEEYETEEEEEEDSDEEYEDEDETEDESEEEEEEDSDEEYEEEEEEDEDETEEETGSEKSSKSDKPNKSTKKKSDMNESEYYEQLSKFMKELRNSHNIKNKNVAKEVKKFESEVLKKKKKSEKSKKKKNIKKYMKLVSNKHTINDLKFFKESLSCKEQEQMIESLESVSKLTNISKPYRIQLLESEHIPDKFKAIAMKKINAMKVIQKAVENIIKLKCWIDTFMRIPFGEIRTLPITRDNTKEEIQEYISEKSTNSDMLFTE